MMGSDVQVYVGPGPGALGLDVASGSLRESAGSEESGSESEWEEEGIAWPSPPNEKTLCAMVEMRDSEEKFVGLVERLVQVYLPKLPPVLTASATALLGRNAAMVLDLHRRIATELKANQASRVGLCHVLSSYAPELTSLHQEFSAGHSAAKALLNRAQAKDPVLWSQWERERADESGPEPDGSRPRSLEDLLIAPIQRVCRYHLLVAGLRDGTEEPHVTDAVLAMQAVAASVDEIVRVRADEDRTKVVLDRMDPIPNLPAGYLASLGPCLLIGTLDVIYYEAPTKPPLVTANSHSSQLTVTSSAASTLSSPPSALVSGKPQKAKHLAAFLWTGYLVLCKVHTKRVRYEPKRWFPLKIVPPNSITLHPNPSVIDSGVSDCDASSSDASPLFPEANLPAVPQQPQPQPQPQQQLALPVIQQLQNKKSYGHIRTKSHSQAQVQTPTQSTLDEQPPTLGLGHVQVQPSDQVFPYGIRINFSRHVFELGASCEEERDIWVRELVAARVGNELVLASDKDKDRGRGVTRSKSAGAVAPSEDTSKALVRGWSDGASTRTREKSLERGALAVRERSKSRERGALSARDKSRERGGAFSDQRSREQSRDPDDRSTIRDDRSTTTTREDKPLPPHPPPEKPPPQRKKSTGVLVPQDGPVQIGNWIVQRLETVSTPSGSITAAPSSHARSPSESLGRNASEGTGSGIYANPHAPSSYSNPHSYSNPSSSYSNPHAPTSYSNPHTPLHPSPTVPSSYSNPHTPATYSNPLSPPASSSSIHSSPPSSFPAERLLPHITGSSTWHTSSEGTGIGERLENVFLRPRYGHGHSHGYGYGYAAAAAPSPHPQGSYAQPGYVGPGGQASYAAPNGQPVYISPNGQYVGPGGGGYVGPTAYGLSRESSQSSSSSTYSTPSTVTPTSYPRSEAPSGYARSEAPSAYARSEAHSNYARSEANSSYARSEGHGGYVRSDASSTAVPLGYARSEAPSNYSRSEAPSNYAPSNYPRSDYAPSINAPSSSSSSTPYGSQVSTPAGHGPNFATSSYAPRFQTRSRANESTLAANVERAFGVAPANGVGADVHRTNSSSTDRSRSFPPSPVTTAQPTLPAPVQPAAPQQQQLAPQPFVRRPSNNTRDPVIMALSDVISSTCREARDRASVKRKPLWMTPEEASAAAEKEKEKAANGMMGMVRPRRMSSALVGSKSKSTDKDKDKDGKEKGSEKDKEKDKEKENKAVEKERKKAAAVARPSSSEGVGSSVNPDKTPLQRKRATIHGAMHAFPSMGPPSPEHEPQSLSVHGHGTPSSQVTLTPSAQQQQQHSQPPVQQQQQPPPRPPSMHARKASDGPISPPRSRTVSSSGSFVDGMRDFLLLRRAFAKSAENMALSAPSHDPPNPIYTVGAGLTNTKSEEGLPRTKSKSGSVPVPGQDSELYSLGAGITNAGAPPQPKRKPRISLRSSSAGSAFFAQLTGKRKSSKNNAAPLSTLTFTPMSEKDKAEYQANQRARESRSRSNEYYRRITPNQGQQQAGPPNRNMLGAELYSSPSSMRLQPSPVAEESAKFIEEGDEGVYAGYR
ncbi:RhoGEF domain, partial [Rhizoctonia solani]